MPELNCEAGSYVVSGCDIDVHLKYSFSRQHAVAAEHFARLAVIVESKPETNDEDHREHRAYVTGSVVFAVAFLESSINELYLEAIDLNPNTLKGLQRERIEVLAELWESIERCQVLNKYQIALAACGKDRFPPGKEPFQGTAALVSLRNVLIHYRPEWDDELDEHKNVEARLKGKFPECAFAGSGTLWFPHRCLGYGCADWAVKQAETFISEFCTRLGIPSRLPVQAQANDA